MPRSKKRSRDNTYPRANFAASGTTPLDPTSLRQNRAPVSNQHASKAPQAPPSLCTPPTLARSCPACDRRTSAPVVRCRKRGKILKTRGPITYSTAPALWQETHGFYCGWTVRLKQQTYAHTVVVRQQVDVLNSDRGRHQTYTNIHLIPLRTCILSSTQFLHHLIFFPSPGQDCWDVFCCGSQTPWGSNRFWPWEIPPTFHLPSDSCRFFSRTSLRPGFWADTVCVPRRKKDMTENARGGGRGV